jgi:hypothetical protein
MSMIELVISALLFIAMLSAVVLYIWRTPAQQQQPVTLRRPVRVTTRRRRREV